MKKTIILALALVVSASFSPVEAMKKKNKEVVIPAQPVELNSSSDSLSYAAGVALTNGLIPYLLQQKMDTTMMADFVRGLREGMQAAGDPKQQAYMIGLDIARQVNERMLPGITEEFKDSPDSIISDLLCRGFVDGIEGDSTVFTYDAAQQFFTKKRAADKIAKENKLYGPTREAGEQFLKENAKKDSVIVLPSGLQYKVLVKGDGEVPLENQKVQVNYEGRLIDGTVFDASSKHGDKPAELTPTQVIKGWTEALTMMPVGSKWQLYIPYYLAYGERGAGDQIKPYSALIFDVELVGIVKN
jgi:FKBP-type peptidyl-prolyl cis-trans isomerase FklB